jgi:hypothetical protein
MEQIYTAAYLGDESALEVLSDSLYDRGHQFNDHICGICPCSWCRWEEGPHRWLSGLLTWGQNLPFRGIDEQHAEQEMAIRIGRALAEAVWTKLYSAERPCGIYVIADMRAERFLEERTPEARQACLEVWTSQHSRMDPDWLSQVLYHIVDASHRTRNACRWFSLSGHLLGGPCKECNALVFLQNGCKTCEGERYFDDAKLARDVVSEALVPWVLSDAPAKLD